MRNGSDSGLPGLVINVIANLVARWRNKLHTTKIVFPTDLAILNTFYYGRCFTFFQVGLHFFIFLVVRIQKAATNRATSGTVHCISMSPVGMAATVDKI